MTIGKRIKRQRIKLGLTADEVGKALGKNRATIYRYESSYIEKLPTTVLEPLAKVLKTTPSYLMGWEDDKTDSLDDLDDLASKYSNIKRIQKKKFPLLGEIACGEPIYADEDKEGFIMADMDIDADFCLTAKGDSMINARIYDGDIVFIKKMPIVDNGAIAAVIIDDEATLKRVYYYPDKNKLVLQAENSIYEPFVYVGEELDQIRILGKAVYFMSEL